MKNKLMTLFLILIYQVSICQTYRAVFDRLDDTRLQLYLSQLQYDPSLGTNIKRDLSNIEGAWMQSYLTMFRATKDIRYLNKFVIHAKRVMDRRNDRLSGAFPISGFPSSFGNCYYNNSSDWITAISSNNFNAPIWSHIEDNLTSCSPEVDILHTGALSFPMAEFVYLTLAEEPQLKTLIVPTEVFGTENSTIFSFEDFALWLRSRLNETLQYHNNSFDNTKGYTIVDDNNNVVSHYLNNQCSIGRTLAFMYLIERDIPSGNANLAAEYLSKTSKIANLLRNKLSVVINTSGVGAYEWCYNNQPTNSQTCQYEDLGHAYIEPEFALICHEYQIPDINNSQNQLYYEIDMQLFANMVANLFYRQPLKFNMNNFGTNGNCPNICNGSPDPLYFNLAGNFCYLSKYNPYIYQILNDYFSETAVHSNSNPDMNDIRTISFLALHETLFNPLAVTRGSNQPGDYWRAVTNGDFDGDGDEDFVAGIGNSDINTYSVNSSHDILPLGSTSGEFVGSWRGLASGELVSNLLGDEIVSVTDNSINIINLSQGLSVVNTLINNGAQYSGVIVGDYDINNPGNEIIVANNSDGKLHMYGYDGSAIIALNLNNSTISTQMAGIASGDFDVSNPGLEIATVNGTNNKIQVWKIDQNNNLVFVTEYLDNSVSNPQYNGLSSGDFDGDGIDEIISHRLLDGFFFILKIKNGQLNREDFEAFPIDQMNGVFCSAKMGISPSRDVLVTLRKFDGQMNIFNLEGLCPGLDLSNLTINEATSIDNNFTSPITINNYPIDYHVSNTLVAGTNFNIDPPSQVEFTAGKEIILTDGFIANAGCDFVASINTGIACQNSTFRQNGHGAPKLTSAPYSMSSISKPLATANIFIQPNPNTGNFIVRTDIEGKCGLIITDLIGKVVYKTDDFEKEIKVDLLDLPKGVYFTKVSGANGLTKTGKIVIQ